MHKVLPILNSQIVQTRALYTGKAKGFPLHS